MKPIISVEGLGKSYTIRHEGQTHYKSLREEIFKLPSRLLRRGGQSREEFWALKDVSFDIMPGDRVGIIGRNGAGKSTLLKLLSRITEPTTGRITLRGRVASLLEVGTGFHPELTGRENIYLNGAILGMSRAEVRRKFDEIVDFAGVEKFLDTPVKRYSSGMYVRLAFAVAAHLEPEILIVDEVLAVGDAEFQKKCLGKMETVGKEGRTVLFVSHNTTAVYNLCMKGIYVEDGIVGFNGDIDKAILYYSGARHKYCAHDGIFDLSDRDNASIIKVIIYDKNMNISGEIHSGDSFYIELVLIGTESFDHIDLAIGFYNEEGVRIATACSWVHDSFTVQPSPDIQRILVKICNNKFSPGLIYLSPSISFYKAEKVYDYAHMLCFMHILDSQDTLLLPPSCGVVTVDANWALLRGNIL